MKTIAALIAGLLLSMTTFVAGLIIAMVYVNVAEEPPRTQNLDTSALWTTEPMSVEKQTLSFQRVPARPRQDEREVASLNKEASEPKLKETTASDAEPVADDPMAVVDPVTTGAIDPAQNDAEPTPRAEQTAAHVEWCSRRYRSYRIEDNSYRPYGGGRRSCESPYSDGVTADLDAEDAFAADPDAQTKRNNAEPREDEGKVEQVIYEDVPSTEFSGDHVQSCMSRYRSYRPEDNSYQPFDGGPRRQCE
ncbi:BA14K family protein [Rhizobium sp. TH2]|uniref:BA14K family protein n=1 Tax=Rhizobium sp. TH2 TaxID=2775403 RepID=UPI002157E98D|nr:BA14K family protein [Rhizobium sp. TH2]UVC11518.1 BA14K family protein [Rhizobium sp. TH2]